MISKNGGSVQFSISSDGKELYANVWDCYGEGKRFLKELENYVDMKGLKLIVPNVINPALENILRKAGYEEYYVEISKNDGDTIQCFRRKKEK